MNDGALILNGSMINYKRVDKTFVPFSKHQATIHKIHSK